MPAPNPQTAASIKEAGYEEFLNKGYEKASMRAIAARAGVTTGAIYGYFPDKAALFTALVEPMAAQLMQDFARSLDSFFEYTPHEQMTDMHATSEQSMDRLLDYIYSHIQAFRLLVRCAGGTPYEKYFDRLVAAEEEGTLRFMQSLRACGHAVQEIDREVIHLLCSAFIHGLFEVVAHDIPKERALHHIGLLMKYHEAGWNRLLGL